MTCRTCRWLDVPLREDGKPRRMYRESAFPCTAPIPPLPASMTRAALHRSYMAPHDGEGCPLHEPRESL
jgi:hypothetical protein